MTLHSKVPLVALALALLPIEAHAISRYNSTSLSCGQARATIRAEGAAILRWRSTTTPGLPRYGRFVASDNFCSAGERAFSTSVPTADRASCQVLECKPYTPRDDDWWLLRRR